MRNEPSFSKISSFITVMIKFTRRTNSAKLALASTKLARSCFFDTRHGRRLRNIISIIRITGIFVAAGLGFLVVVGRGCLIGNIGLKIHDTVSPQQSTRKK
jgi:hypothetical protein